jgi:hypothetical protein
MGKSLQHTGLPETLYRRLEPVIWEGHWHGINDGCSYEQDPLITAPPICRQEAKGIIRLDEQSSSQELKTYRSSWYYVLRARARDLVGTLARNG